MRNLIRVIFFVLAVFLFAGVLNAFSENVSEKITEVEIPESIPRYIRVAIAKNVDRSVFRSESFLVKAGNDTFNCGKAYLKVSVYDNSFYIGKERLAAKKIIIYPSKKRFRFKGNEYSGCIVLLLKGKRFTVVNYVYLEDYLKSVLPYEAYPGWNIEVLKAQAVASRSYALFNEIVSKDKDYSLESDTMSQVYGCRGKATFMTDKAVDETCGEVICRGDKLLLSFFHSSCGGMTENVENVWPSFCPSPALVAVVCPYCRGTKNYYWENFISFRSIEKKLARKYGRLKIHFIKGNGLTSGGRIKSFTVFSKGKNIVIPANDFRLMIGPAVIKSLKISELKVSDDGFSKSLKISGYGWGHGVGMCQWGAAVMADKGYGYSEILRYYYKGTTVKKLFLQPPTAPERFALTLNS